MRFYVQAAVGQATLMLARRDTGAVLADPATAPETASRLRLIARLLRFAETELELPVGGRYGSFVDTDGVLLWNVVAAPEFGVAAVPRCYPVVGCAVYRGYFSHGGGGARGRPPRGRPRRAHRTGGGVLDPRLVRRSDPGLVPALRRGELGRTDLPRNWPTASCTSRATRRFNESFATFVGIRGAMAWLVHSGGDTGSYAAGLAARTAYRGFLGLWRDRLASLYGRPIADDAKRQLKAEAFTAMRACYRRHRARLGNGRYDAAMATPIQQCPTGAGRDLRRSEAGLRGRVQRRRRLAGVLRRGEEARVPSEERTPPGACACVPIHGCRPVGVAGDGVRRSAGGELPGKPLPWGDAKPPAHHAGAAEFLLVRP